MASFSQRRRIPGDFRGRTSSLWLPSGSAACEQGLRESEDDNLGDLSITDAAMLMRSLTALFLVDAENMEIEERDCDSRVMSRALSQNSIQS